MSWRANTSSWGTCPRKKKSPTPVQLRNASVSGQMRWPPQDCRLTVRRSKTGFAQRNTNGRSGCRTCWAERSAQKASKIHWKIRQLQWRAEKIMFLADKIYDSCRKFSFRVANRENRNKSLFRGRRWQQWGYNVEYTWVVLYKWKRKEKRKSRKSKSIKLGWTYKDFYL